MELVSVDSSMIQAVGYDSTSEELEVLFNSGKTYRYKGVPRTVYEELLTADSKGQYMRANVIGVYLDYQVSRRRR